MLPLRLQSQSHNIDRRVLVPILQARFAALVEKCLYRVPLAYLAGLVGLAFALGFVVRGVV